MGQEGLTCFAKTAMSSLKESEEHTSPPATPGSRGVQVASSHFSKTRANRGNNGCLTGSATQRHTHRDGVQRGRSKNCNQQVWRDLDSFFLHNKHAHIAIHNPSSLCLISLSQKQKGKIKLCLSSKSRIPCILAQYPPYLCSLQETRAQQAHSETYNGLVRCLNPT